ncbi:MAG: YncE family protein [Acidimicrobiales bacterium]
MQLLPGGTDDDEIDPTEGDDGVATIYGGASCRIGGGGPAPYRLLGEVPVGLDPEGIAVHRRTGMAYVSCSRSNAVAVVDIDRLALVAEVPVGIEPIDIAIDHQHDRVFTADARSDRVTVIDAATNQVTATIPVGSYPAGLCIDEEGRRLYVGDAVSSTMSVIDLDLLERIATVEAELGAGAVTADPIHGRVYCVNFVASSVTVVDAKELEVVARVPLLQGPCAAGADPVHGDVFVADSLASTVTRIDGATSTIAGEMPVPNAPVGLTVGSTGDRLYVANRGDGSVSVLGIDGREWARIPVGAAPGGVTEDPRRRGRVLVANAGSSSISVVEDLLDGPPTTTLEELDHPLVGQQLPRIPLVDLWTEELRDLGEWAGRKYVVNVFASW